MHDSASKRKECPVCPSNQCAQRPLALYGLAANPPHARHWDCVKWLIAQGFDVLVAPSFSHAFGKAMAPFEQRAAWLELSGQEFHALGPHARVWTREREVAMGKKVQEPVYSIEMLDAALHEFGAPPRLAIGPDNAAADVFCKFKSHDLISSQFGVVAMPDRVGDRSSAIRQRLAQEGDGAWLDAEVGSQIARDVARAFAKPMGIKGP